MLDVMTQWLQTFPKWEDALQIDYLEAVPGNTGLYPRGLTELSRQEDVLGNLKIRYRWNFLLRKAACGEAEDAKWLMEFQNWVAQQSAAGNAPKFGDDPRRERIHALDGRLDSRKQSGSTHYTLQLIVEFSKTYRGE